MDEKMLRECVVHAGMAEHFLNHHQAEQAKAHLKALINTLTLPSGRKASAARLKRDIDKMRTALAKLKGGRI